MTIVGRVATPTELLPAGPAARESRERGFDWAARFRADVSYAEDRVRHAVRAGRANRGVAPAFHTRRRGRAHDVRRSDHRGGAPLMFGGLSDDAIAPPLTRGLRDCVPCAPLPAQQRIIHAAIARACELGLTIPAGVRILTVEVDRSTHEGIQAGEFDHDPRTGLIRVYLDVGPGVWPENLARTTLHEARHLHDAATGRAWDRVAWARSAIAFAADAWRGWR